MGRLANRDMLSNHEVMNEAVKEGQKFRQLSTSEGNEASGEEKEGEADTAIYCLRL
jgi:hypothetical protein